MAMQMHREGRLEDSQTLYRRVLAAAPGHAGATNGLGMLRHQLGASDEAVALIERATQLSPQDGGFLNNLGNVHLECGRSEQAIDCYRRAVALQPDSPMALNNLGHALREAGHHREARECFLQALRLDPTFARVYSNLGILNGDENHPAAAVECFRLSLGFDPDQPSVRKLMARAQMRLGDVAGAAETFRAWLQREPGNPVAVHMLAACAGAPTPKRADDAYIEATFDDFAGTFDSLLTEKLDYRAPQLCAELVARLCPAPAAQWRVLDAGCGTGLVGPLVRPWARRLHGADLSGGMLAKARARGVYDELHKAELTDFLQRSPARWDLIVSADTLCYFGDLAALMKAAAGALTPGAPFVFTVEALPDGDGDDYALRPHGRYAHGAAYLHRLIADNALEAIGFEQVVLRKEGGLPVQGWLVAARRGGAVPGTH